MCALFKTTSSTIICCPNAFHGKEYNFIPWPIRHVTVTYYRLTASMPIGTL